MKRSFIISTILHVGVILGLVIFSPVKPVLQGYPTIYRVGLVSLPSGGRRGGGGEGEASGEAKASITKQPDKGVTVKEVDKTSRKKKTPQKKPATKKSTTPTKKEKEEGKVTQGDDLGEQYGLGNGISAATVDGTGFGSSYYLSLVFGKIRDMWENPVQTSATLQVTIYFRILRNGQIIEAQVEKTSGIDLFDQSAMRSIISSAPFPPLPTEYRGEYLGIHLEFEYIQ